MSNAVGTSKPEYSKYILKTEFIHSSFHLFLNTICIIFSISYLYRPVFPGHLSFIATPLKGQLISK